jgi:hypothetical protein
MKLKKLAAAVLTAMAGNVSAALLKDGFTPGIPSDLLLAVYDDSTGLPSSGKTYLLNTRVSYKDIVNGTVRNKTIDLSGDANYQALKAQGSKLKFNIVGGYALATDFSNYDKTGGSGKPFTDSAGTQWGVLTTGQNAADFNGDFINLSSTAGNNLFAYWKAANVKLAAAGATADGGPDSALVPKGDPQASFDLAWNGNFGGAGIANVATANLVNGIGTAAKLFWVTNTDFDKGAVVELGTWTLTGGDKLVFTGSGAQPEPQNQPPVADAGADRSIASGAAVTLDGSGSRDPDNDPLSYAWSQVSGPASVTLAGANTAKATFTAGTQGVYVFKLAVGDGKENRDDTVQITVTAAVPQGPGITLNVPAVWQVGKAQTIGFTGHQISPSLKVKIQFSKNGGRKYRVLKNNFPLKKGGYRWKPAKSHVTRQGLIQVCAKVDKKPLCSAPASIVVEPKPKKK